MKKKNIQKKKKKIRFCMFVSSSESNYRYFFKKNSKTPNKIKKFDPKIKKYVYFYEKKK
ncbi:50S ribosomal protein L33 [Candidatus Vidania fulgoroideae]|nr:50S ribosomal protein L33 [Candidatus Vidania fulgoroideae]